MLRIGCKRRGRLLQRLLVARQVYLARKPGRQTEQRAA
jgi:hypothetical protein